MGEKHRITDTRIKVFTELVDNHATSATVTGTFFLLGNDVKEHTPTLCPVNYNMIIPFGIILHVNIHNSHH